LEIHNPPAENESGITVTFMATTTLIISDGETTLITDGYFTRTGVDLSTGFGALVEPSSPEWLIFSN
jgi:hypothetical protein